MEKQYCINCMEQFDGNLSRCPHCGYEQTAEPFPFGVKPDTILRGRYLVGRVLNGILYSPWRIKLNCLKKPWGSSTPKPLESLLEDELRR